MYHLYFKAIDLTIDFHRRTYQRGRNPEAVQIDYLHGDPSNAFSHGEKRIVNCEEVMIMHISAVDMLDVLRVLHQIGKLRQIDMLFIENSEDFLNSICHAAVDAKVPGEVSYFKSVAYSSGPAQFDRLRNEWAKR